MRKFKIFYSWQYDLPANKTRNFIRNCIDEAIGLAEAYETIEAERDEATKDITGSPNIVTTMFSKIEDCDLFIADISLCFTSDTKENKKSPNPNVLLELGYAVKILGWERVICICNTDFGDAYPFDIAHNRITGYSLKCKKENASRNYIRKIIFENIKNLKNAKPRVKTGEAMHILGAYDFSECVVKETLTPINLTHRESYILHNEELLEEAKVLFSEIKDLEISEISQTKLSEVDSLPSSKYINSPIENIVHDVVSKMFQKIETPAEWKEAKSDAKLIMKWLKVKMPEDFFYLGNLRYVIGSYNQLQCTPSLMGTEAEKEKYHKLYRLSQILTLLEMRTGYLKSFENMLFFPIAIQNITTLQDENIRVVLKVEIGEIVEPNENLIWSEYGDIQGDFCRDDDNDVGIICELFCLDEDGIISVETVAYIPEEYAIRIPIITENGLTYPKKKQKKIMCLN